MQSSLALRTLRHTHIVTQYVSVLTKLLLLTTGLLIEQHVASDSDVGTLSDPEGAAVVESSIALKQVVWGPYIHYVNRHAGK
jgi:hypothetical protein